MKTGTTAEIKKQNRNAVFRLIYGREKIAKQDIADALNMSLPTVTNFLRELQQLGLIQKNGVFASSGGRKPQVISCNKKSRYSIGVEILKTQLRLISLDLCGNAVHEQVFDLEYENTEAYYRDMGGKVAAFAALLKAPKKILGVVIAIQGLLDVAGTTVTYSPLLGCAGATLADFSTFIPFDCLLIHDSEAAACAELWFSGEIQDAVYLSLSTNLGGAVILDGRIHKGRSVGSGLVEHMTVEPGGLPCYCGKRGCLECYCSVTALAGSRSDLATFFTALRAGSAKQVHRWEIYLDDLAAAVNNIHRVLDCTVILGGHIAPYLLQSDMDKLAALVESKSSFPEPEPYIRIGSCTHLVVATGAALQNIAAFIASV